jgi:tRNA 2-thiouridine synthesizing protein C|tara:strand:+ start:890 stop:1261 length:372 start_codon:yes stop_codon:yes gene_type:complete
MTGSQNKRILVVCSQAPNRGNLAREALDTAFAVAAFEQSVCIYFSGEGVWQLLAAQQTNLTTGKAINSSWKAASLYDIVKLYVSAEELAKRNINADELIEGISVINPNDVNDIMADQDLVLSF